MKRKTLRNLLAVAALLCVGLGAAACGGNDSSSSSSQDSSSESSSVVKITLADFEDESKDVGYGEKYELELQAIDTDGKYQALSATVTKTDGTPVDVTNGKFVVDDKQGYIVTYSFTSAGETVTKTVTLNVKALKKPVVHLDGSLSVVLLGDSCTLPTATVYDYFDGDLTAQIEVYKKGESTDLKMEYNTADGTFTATEEGDYYVSYTATNSADTTESRQVDFYVRKPVFINEESTDALVVEPTTTIAYNRSISGVTLVESGEESVTADFTGGYTGDAVRIPMWTNPSFFFDKPCSDKELADMVTVYNTVSLWVAIDGIQSGTILLLSNGENQTFVSAACNGETYRLNHTMQKQWFKFSLPLSEYIRLLQVYSGNTCNLFRSYLEVVFPDTNGNGTFEESERGAFYIGALEFSYQPPQLLTMDATSHSAVANPDVAGTYMANGAESELADFTGGYTGNAKRFAGKWTNRTFRLKNAYTVEQLKQIKKLYNSVTVWFAVDNIASGTMTLFSSWTSDDKSTTVDYLSGKAKCPDGKTGGFTKEENGAWNKWVVDIDDYIALATAADGVTANEYIYLFYTYNQSLVAQDGKEIYVYVGDILFANVDITDYPNLVKMTQSTHTKVYNNDVKTQSYITAAELATLHIAGEYAGNATRFQLIGSAVTNSGYRFNNEYTTEELNKFKTKYNSVSMWVAMTGITSKTVSINKNGIDNHFSTVGKAVEFTTTPTWQKLTVTIDEYMTMLAANDNKYCSLMATASWNGATFDENGVYLYFGDIYFENVQAQA